MTPAERRRRADDSPAWWSSADGQVDPDEDPLASHLAARGLHAVGDEDVTPPGDRADEPGPKGDRPDDPPDQSGSSADRAEHAPGICGVCPICRGHAVLRDRHPEVADHLADAARSLSAALATFADLVEADGRPDRGADGRPDPGTGPTRARGTHDDFRPITLDDEEGGRR